jgi:hypothetical protein
MQLKGQLQQQRYALTWQQRFLVAVQLRLEGVLL